MAAEDGAGGVDDAGLRDALVAELRAVGSLRSPEVERAFRAVPRHLFVPEVSPGQAYAAERAQVTKRDGDGVALSSVSAPSVQAFMLEQARVRPGMRVLEIGSGGCNAALLAELVGPGGEVVTLDIDPDVVGRARTLLPAAGYGRVEAVLGDGDAGLPGRAPFDRIVVTVEAAEVAPAWVAQLAPGGRIVVPLRMRGLTRSVAFHRADGGGDPGGGADGDGDGGGDVLVSRDYEACGFVRMRGAGAVPERLVVLHGGAGDDDGGDGGGARVALRVEDGESADADALRAAFGGERAEEWAGPVLAPSEWFGDLDLWLATVLPGYARLVATPEARDRGLVAAPSVVGLSTLLDGGSFAYLAMRPTTPERTAFEFGAVGHGPRARQAAAELAERMRVWGGEVRGSRAEITSRPRGAALPAGFDGLVVERPRTRLTVGWGRAG